MRAIPRSATRVGLALLCVLTAACAPAAVGAAGGIGYTQRGATALVQAQVPEVFQSTAAVFEEMGIELTDRRGRGARSAVGNDITINGRRGTADVLVSIERETNASSEVFVQVREGRADYNRELAGEILSRIVAKR
ncbi:MAG: hypothetical protein AVDCRST_MAG89-4145 [uncultured Gemmatimonadetes bacterium]|uniref:DUF3568 family protein n=1 Tax=uncultured Gemmatimonadota bacterium TaxID=203437 RepID=A0A6J4MTI7_9BACT|nr:MAG: hypothetical protein AVDCRST_MAG89-4145 [uncultured Gemmatimonadota bacterium]